MPGKLVPVGPFLGGLNTFSDPSSIADNELAVALNVELDLDGSVKSRPPFVDAAINFPLGATGNFYLLGYYYDSSGNPYLLASNGLDNTYYFTGSSWVSIFSGTTFAATAMTQYDNKAWLVAPLGSSGSVYSGYWTPAGGFVADVYMPKGDVIVNFKDRLWIGRNTSTLILYSNILTDAAGMWTTTIDQLNVGAGDGQSTVQLLVYFNSILIFRDRSIWSFSYSGDPGAGGTLSQVIGGIGLSSKESVAQFESYVYFMFEDRAYEFTNGRAAHLNIKTPFRAVNQAGIYMPFAVSEFNRRIIFSYYDNMYVYNLVTRTWTMWNTSVYGSIGKVLKRESDSTTTLAYANSSTNVTGGTRNAKTITISDTLTSSGESMTCVIQTKNMDYGIAAQYKRLFWWGLDASFRGTITAIASPITYLTQVTWGQLLATTWGNLRNFTWGQPQTPQVLIETVRSVTGTTPGRRFFKFLKSLRFRQIYYKLSASTMGTLDTAPVRIFRLDTFVGVKETVSKAIT